MTIIFYALGITAVLLLGFAAGLATGRMEAEEEAMDALCECGHRREEHVYHEGPCRPGYRCFTECTAFRRVTR